MSKAIYQVVIGVITLLILAGTSFSQTTMSGINSHPDDIYWSDIFYPRTFDGNADCFVEYDGELIVGGYFDVAPGFPANGIARWNGISWQPVGTGVEVFGWCEALAVYHDTLYAAGNFNFHEDSTDFSIIYWDGSNWYPLMIDVDGDIAAMIVHNDMLVAGGCISRVSGINLKNIFGWNGANVIDLSYDYESIQPEDRIDALVIYEDTLLIAAGYRFDPDYYAHQALVMSWNGVEWNTVGQNTNGLYESSQIYDLAVYDSMLIVCGEFNDFEGIGAVYIAAWDKSTWSSLVNSIDGGVLSLAVCDGSLFAGGHFTAINDSTVNGIAQWDGSNWSSCAGGLTLTDGIYLDGEVNSLYSLDSNLIASGYFQEIGGIGAEYLAQWNGSSWSGYNLNSGEGLNGSIDDFAVYNGMLVAIGRFGNAGGEAVDSFAAWDGQSWSSLNFALPGTNESKSDVITYNNMLVVGGAFYPDELYFDSYKAIAYDGQEWFAIDSVRDLGGHINDMAIYNNMLYVGGFFDSIGNIQSSNIAAWDGIDWYQVDGISENIRSLTAYGGKLIVAGDLTAAGEVPVNGIAAWDGEDWSALGEGVTGYIEDMAVYDNKLMVAVSYSDSADNESHFITVWDGSDWSQLTDYYPFVGKIKSLSVYNNMLIVGAKNPYDEYFSPACLAAWNAGDSSWYYMGSGISGIESVNALISYEQALYAGGSFDMAGGKASSNIARWNGRVNICGDANGNMSLDIMDAVFVINYLYKDGARPVPMEASDTNGNGSVDVMDAVYLINYLYKGGPEPYCP